MGLSTNNKHVPVDQSGPDWSEQSKPPSSIRRQPQHQSSETLKCPRCGSNNTKFCYYNNYNKTQPRHLCKSCKRHWTKGGTLRNVPVGGARKNKRPKISNTTTAPQDMSKVNPLSRDSDDDYGKGMSKSKANYETLIRSSSPLLHDTTTDGISTVTSTNSGKPLTGSNSMMNHHHQIISPNSEFQFTSLSTFDDHMMMNASTANWYHHHESSNFINVLDRSMEESTITNIPWDNSSSGGANLDDQLPNYWNWNEIDVLASSANNDHLNISWGDDDGAEIKP